MNEATMSRTDTDRLDWIEDHMNEVPCLGFYTNGNLGLSRGHIVETKWTVKGKGYSSYRAAVDAAMDGAA